MIFGWLSCRCSRFYRERRQNSPKKQSKRSSETEETEPVENIPRQLVVGNFINGHEAPGAADTPVNASLVVVIDVEELAHVAVILVAEPDMAAR